MKSKKDIKDLFKDKLNLQEFDIQEEWLNNMSNQLDNYNAETKSKKGIIFILAGLILLFGLLAALFLSKEKSQNKNLHFTTDVKIKEKREKQPYKLKNQCNEYTQYCKTQNSKNLVDKNRNLTNIKAQKQKTTENFKPKKNSEIIPIKKEISPPKDIDIKEINKNSKETKAIEIQKELFIKTDEENDLIQIKKNKEVETIKSYSKNKTNKVDNSPIFNSKNQPSTKITNTSLYNFNNLSLKESIKKLDTLNISEKNHAIEVLLLLNDSLSLKSQNSISLNKDLKSTANEQFYKKRTVQNVVDKENKIDSLQYNIKIDNDSILLNNDDIIVKDKNPYKELGVSIALKVGPSFLFRNFDSKNIKRTQEESNIISWNAGLEIYKTFKNNLIIGTGIQIVNYGEKIDYSTITESYKDTSYNFIENYYSIYNLNRENGVYSFDTLQYNLLVIDTVTNIIDKTKENKSVKDQNGQTNFMYIEIPVMIGYKILKTSKIDINLTTGISIGFLSFSKGSYLNKENILEKAASKKIVYNYILATDFKYNLFKNISLSLSPHFRYNLNNLSTIDNTKRNYTSFSVNGGIILDF